MLSILPFSAAAAIAISVFAFPNMAEAKAAKVTRQVALSSDFTTTELGWLGRSEKGFILRWRTEVNNGIIEICGAVTYPDSQNRSASKGVLRKSYITYGDKKIMNDLRHFYVVKSVAKQGWKAANCASTCVRAPTGQYSVSLGWSAGRAKF